ncbi:MAG: RDD family protein [Elusimicrobiaceae bacterium]|nr:RDD family protein [Elusimicrobiaceae bacterium]
MNKPSLWRLLGAYGMDFFLISFAFIWFTFLAWAFWGISGAEFLALIWGKDAVKAFLNSSLFYEILVSSSYAIVYLLFFFVESRGRSLGKEVFKLRVLGKCSFWRVIGAYSIDLALLCFFIPLIVSHVGGISDASYEYGLPLLFSVLFFSNMIVMIYFPCCELCFGKTLGKKLMGLQIVQDVPQKQ